MNTQPDTVVPNILLFHCHDLGRHLGCYGIPTVRTPNIDRLAREGVRFERSFCVAPQCSPSRAALFTGRYPHNNGVMGLTHSRFAWDLGAGEKHLAQLLRDRGYNTVSIGVTHETRQPAGRWGFVEQIDLQRGRCTGEEDARADIVADATIGVLERYRDNARSGASLGDATTPPFFICAGCYEPHRIAGSREESYMGFVGDYIERDGTKGVYVPPYLRDDPGTRDELEELQGAIRFMDHHFGRLLDAVDRLGLREDTLVIFTTDHGIAMPRAKCSCYDPGLETALVLRLPSRPGWNGGRVVSELIPHIDLTPTLCDLTGADVPETVQGRSWRALLDGERYQPNREFFPELTYHDYYDPMRGVRTERYKLLAFFSSAHSFMPPNQSWARRSSPLIPETPPTSYHPEFELYDLERDPWEQDNLADREDYREVRNDLMRRLRDHMVATGDPILQGAVTSPLHRRVLEELSGKFPRT